MFDFKAFGEQLVVTLREHVTRAVAPVSEGLRILGERMASVEKTLMELPDTATELEAIRDDFEKRYTGAWAGRFEESFKAAISGLPPPQDGKSVDTAELADLVAKSVAQIAEAMPKPPTADDLLAAAMPLIERAVGAIPVPKAENGKDADVDAITADVLDRVTKALEAIPAPRDGRDVDPQVLADAVRVEVQRAVADFPRPQDGKSIDATDLAQEIVKAAAVVVDAMPAPQIPAEAIAEIVDSRFAEAVKALQPADDTSGVAALADALIAKFTNAEHAA